MPCAQAQFPLVSFQVITMQRRTCGSMGESIAAEYLGEKGYTLRERNFRSGHLETDIICENSTHILFVEVKSRRKLPSLAKYGRPCAAVTPKKAQNLLACAAEYLRQHEVKKKPRIDVIEVYFEQDGSFRGEIKHIENAVTADAYEK